MFFRYNQQEQPVNNEDFDNNALFKFFRERNKEELETIANDVSINAKQLFEGTLQGLLGQLPEDMNCQTNVSMSKDALKQLLFSSMMTGYLSKVAENRLQLEQCWNDDVKTEEDFSIESQIKQIDSHDPLDEIL